MSLRKTIVPEGGCTRIRRGCSREGVYRDPLPFKKRPKSVQYIADCTSNIFSHRASPPYFRIGVDDLTIHLKNRIVQKVFLVPRIFRKQSVRIRVAIITGRHIIRLLLGKGERYYLGVPNVILAAIIQPSQGRSVSVIGS